MENLQFLLDIELQDSLHGVVIIAGVLLTGQQNQAIIRVVPIVSTNYNSYKQQ